MRDALIAMIFLGASLIGCTAGHSSQFEPTLIRGRIPDKNDFKAIVWVGGCTGTIIGPKVLTLAAHCVSDRIQISIGKDKFNATCMVSKEYAKGVVSADYALCSLDQEAEGPYEVVNFDEGHVKIGDEILLSGYGCQKWGGPIDGRFRIGEAHISDLGKGNADNYLVASDGATLCSGDSGGPSWSLQPDGKRAKLIGLNSRSDTKKTSYISYIAKPEGKRFFEVWSAMNPDLKICGLHKDAKNCFGVKDTVAPSIENTFEIKHEVADISVLVKKDFTGLIAKLKRFLWETLEVVKP